jgi:2-iminobutanoate/2-iminopropanoate deaminase
MIDYPLLPDTPVSHLPYSPVVRVGHLVFVSGQASVDATGRIIGDSFAGEFARSLDNMERVLRAAGCTLADVVQTRNYLRDPADLAEYNRLYAERFRRPYPARTTLTGCLPVTLRYEVECVAVVPGAASS